MSLQSDLAARLDVLNKAVFSAPVEKDTDSRVTVRPVLLKGKPFFQFAARRGAQELHRNVAKGELPDAVEELCGKYRSVVLCTKSETRQYILRGDGTYKCSGKTFDVRTEAELSHNHEKQYLLCEGENIPALVDLGVFTKDFKIVRSKYDKFKQINRFIELVDDAFSDWKRDEITILDFGCGKSYLTFLLYYYFAVRRNLKTTVIGYDLKADVVDRCNTIAKRYGYDRLHFVCADVTHDVLYDEPIDMIVTLHACDVATDYALFYAIEHRVSRIFSVPCCQHEINAQIKKGGDFDLLLSHGLFRERFSALLTDAIRTQVLEDYGYDVDVLEFIDFAHSPKNLMLRAVKNERKSHGNSKSARALAVKYGFRQTLLDLTETT